MLSLIEVQCPHCGARGQVILPPVGSIIIGPCPECQNLVIIFMGKALAIDKTIMADGTFEERSEHLMEVLTDFIRERIERMIVEFDEFKSKNPGKEKAGDFPQKAQSEESEAMSSCSLPITNHDLETFRREEMSVLDLSDSDAFRAIFGSGGEEPPDRSLT